jgi:hypothetical protein
MESWIYLIQQIVRKIDREINSIFEDLDGCGDQHWIFNLWEIFTMICSDVFGERFKS